MQQTDSNIAQLKQQQEQQFAQTQQQIAQTQAQTQQQIVQTQAHNQQQIAHINQSILHRVQLVQNFPSGNPGANYVQASYPSEEFH